MSILDKPFIFGINYSFFIIALPVTYIIWLSHYLDWRKKKIQNRIRADNLPNQKIYLDLTKEEKWMLENLATRNKYNTEKYIRMKLKELQESEVSLVE